MAGPKQTDPQFKLRLTPEIKEAIEKSAVENNRSLNAEILSRLETSLSGTSENLAILEQKVEMLETELRLTRNIGALWQKRSEERTAAQEKVTSTMDAVCWHVMSHRKEIPVGLYEFARAMLKINHLGDELENEYLYSDADIDDDEETKPSEP